MKKQSIPSCNARAKRRKVSFACSISCDLHVPCIPAVVLNFSSGSGPSHSSAEASETTSGEPSTGQEGDAESATLRGSSEAPGGGDSSKSGGGFLKKPGTSVKLHMVSSGGHKGLD